VATYVRAILLACDMGLSLTVTPIRQKKHLIIEVSALTAERRSHKARSVTFDCSARTASRKSRCGISLEARWPPCPIHTQLSRRRRSARGAWSGPLIRNRAAMGLEVRTVVLQALVLIGAAKDDLERHELQEADARAAIAASKPSHTIRR
jgi:hypothetical protein